MSPLRHDSLPSRIHERLAVAGNRTTPFVLLAVRLLVGFETARSGVKHLVNFEGTSGYFASLHIPFPEFALVLSATAELIGGIALIAGLGTRAACVPLLINFAVAYLTSGRQALVLLLTLQDAWKFVTYPAFPFLLTSALLFAIGPGSISLDRLLFGSSAAGNRTRETEKV